MAANETKYYCPEGHPPTETGNCGPCEDECLAECGGQAGCRHQQALYARVYGRRI